MKVLLATPAHDARVTDIYLQSIVRLLAESHALGVEISVMTLSGESLITRARNNIVSVFLGGDWDNLLFVDGDIGFQPENVWRLLDSPYPVAATSYPLKKLDWDAVSVASNPVEAKELSVVSVVNYIPESQVTDDGFAPVLDAGTGFMRIHRSALLTLIDAYPEKQYIAEEDGETKWALFDTEIHDGRYLSEDYSFCRMWQRLGGQVMVDMEGPSLRHRGIYEYGE